MRYRGPSSPSPAYSGIGAYCEIAGEVKSSVIASYLEWLIARQVQPSYLQERVTHSWQTEGSLSLRSMVNGCAASSADV